MGKRERERIKALENAIVITQRVRPDKDEIALGRAVRLVNEGRGEPFIFKDDRISLIIYLSQIHQGHIFLNTCALSLGQLLSKILLNE